MSDGSAADAARTKAVDVLATIQRAEDTLRGYGSHRRRGSCDNPNPAECRFCDDMDAAIEVRLADDVLALADIVWGCSNIITFTGFASSDDVLNDLREWLRERTAGSEATEERNQDAPLRGAEEG